MDKFITFLFSIFFVGAIYLGVMHLKKNPEKMPDFSKISASFGKLKNSDSASKNKSKEQLPMPKHGATKAHLGYSLDKNDPRLDIQNVSNTYYAYVKLERASDRKTAAEFFVYPGKTLNTNMQAGRYYIKVASGKKWYGRNSLFGKNTSIYEYPTTMLFDGIPIGANSKLKNTGIFYTRPGFVSLQVNIEKKNIFKMLNFNQW